MVHLPGQEFQEHVELIDDPVSGAKGVIVIHSTALGPAAGGCRFWTYDSHDNMMTDASRLARGMSYKNALAGLPFGGGKAVLQVPRGDYDRKALFRAFGETVARLEGRYVTAEDVGTTIADMQAVRESTHFVAGLTSKPGLAGGDPSPWTSLGVFESMRAAARNQLDLDLKGATVAVQGVGNVGVGLCRLLSEAGACLIVADIDEARAERVAKDFGAKQVGVDEVLQVEADVYAPCALGAVLNDVSIPKLRARLICGGANNQLENAHHGEALRAAGILYAPDYVVNAGGIINVAAEYLGESAKEVEARVRAIAPRLLAILRKADAEDRATNLMADDLARDAIGSSQEKETTRWFNLA
jgi:leucine dehydrogenase